MTDPETSREISERTSSIVRIAYHQLSIMCGTRDPTAPASVTPANVASTNANGCNMVCTRRLLNPVTSVFSNAYAIVKGSHKSIESILNYAEGGMRASLEFASPVTGRIAGVLQTPLKTVDNAVCVGLDFIEERMPSGQIYANAKDSVRNIFTSALETLRLLFGGSKNRIEDVSVASKTAQEEIRKVSN